MFNGNFIFLYFIHPHNKDNRETFFFISFIFLFLLISVNSCISKYSQNTTENSTSQLGTAFESNNETVVQQSDISSNSDTIPADPVIDKYSIGTSIDGIPLMVAKIGNGKKAGLVVAGALHGNEKNTKALVQALQKSFSDGAELLPSSVCLFFIPEINPDGVKRKTRRNLNDVDLNRNFPTDDWKKDAISPSKMLPGSGGSEPGSEPEVQALTDWLIKRVKPDVESVYLISFHAAYPPTGSVQPGYRVYGEPGPESNRFAQYVAQQSGFKYLKTWITKLEITGEFIHWCEMNDIWSCDIELPDYNDPLTVLPGKEKSVYTVFENTLTGILKDYLQ